MGPQHEASNYPDGLDEATIDALINEVASELGVAPALLGGGPAIKRRGRRATRRTLGDTVRILRVHSVSASAETEAA